MGICRNPLGLRLPAHTPCAPACPDCLMKRLADVERAVRDQRPDVEEPRVAGALLVLGVTSGPAADGRSLGIARNVGSDPVFLG